MEFDCGSLSQSKQTGRPPRDRRQVVDGKLWIPRTGSPRRDWPDVFGRRATGWDVFDTWDHDGTLQAILNRLRGQVKTDDVLWCIDGTIVRAAGGGKKRFRRAARPRAPPEPWRVELQNPLVVWRVGTPAAFF